MTLNAEQMAEWEAWVASRPEVVQAMARKMPPWNTYRVTSTGQCAQVVAYGEDGTVRVNVWRDDGPPGFEELTFRQVFGMDPNDFTPIEDAP